MMKVHDYGLSKKVEETTPWSRTSIREEKPYKTVILVNVDECRDRITVEKVRKSLIGETGWECGQTLLAKWLVEAIVGAINNGEDEADITKLFTCNLRGENMFGTYIRPQVWVINILMAHLFKCVEENDKMMRVCISEEVISRN